ncbi:DMT family transporter [Leeia sp.]|uniref:DMT family transporter n=1 Tax=Leeia sp. TaxID=2884678 RepID=UPI0035B252AD
MSSTAEHTFANHESGRLHWWQDGRILALLSATCFSLKAIFIKLAYAAGPVDAITLLAMRMGLALPAFILLARWGGGSTLSRREWFHLFLLGVTGYYLSSLFDFIGLKYITAGLERLILFTYPGFVLLADALIHGKRVRLATWGALAISYLGLVLAFWHDLMLVNVSQQVWIGSAWVLASCLTYALYYLGSGVMVKRVGSSRLAGYAGAFSSGLVLSQFMLTRSPAILLDLSLPIWGYAIAMALISTVLPIWLAARAVARLGAGQTAALGTIGPALTIFFGWIILSEPFSWVQLLGLVLVVYGISRLQKKS